MDRTSPRSNGEAGIFEIGRRSAEVLGGAPEATRFSCDPREMLGTTPQIEARARGGRLGGMMRERIAALGVHPVGVAA